MAIRLLRPRAACNVILTAAVCLAVTGQAQSEAGKLRRALDVSAKTVANRRMILNSTPKNRQIQSTAGSVDDHPDFAWIPAHRLAAPKKSADRPFADSGAAICPQAQHRPPSPPE